MKWADVLLSLLTLLVSILRLQCLVVRSRVTVVLHDVLLPSFVVVSVADTVGTNVVLGRRCVS